MNLGQRLVDLTAAGPFTGAGMSLATTLSPLRFATRDEGARMSRGDLMLEGRGEAGSVATR